MTVRPGVAETARAQVARVTREARRGEENIVVKIVKAIEETTRVERWDERARHK